MRTKKVIQEELSWQRPPLDDPKGLPVSEETRTRTLVAILNTNMVVAELLLDIREILKKKV